MDLSLFNIYEIIGIVITVVTALVTYLKSRPEAKDRNATLASVLGVMLTILLGVRFEVLPKVQGGLVEADSIRADQSRRNLFEKVAKSNASNHGVNPLIDKVLKARMANLQQQFDIMASGQFIVNEAEMPTFLIEMANEARHSIDTTNYIGLSRWWEQAWGSKYEDANERASRTWSKNPAHIHLRQERGYFHRAGHHE